MIVLLLFNMYSVIQFDDSGNNSVAVVHESWLTPMKTEVFWPPFKDTRNYKRALCGGEEAIDTESWKLYGINRIFYQTDELEKAFKKEKEAEITSDLADTDVDLLEKEAPTRQSRKYVRKIIDSSESEGESQYPRPPQIKIKKLSGFIETRQLQNSGSKHTPEQTLHPAVQHSSNQKGTLITKTIQQSTLNKQSRDSSDCPSQVSSAFSDSGKKIDYDDIVSATKTFISLLGQIKEQNNLILGKLDEVQNSLSVQIPLTKSDDLKIFEEFISKTENFNLLVTHLHSLGGKNIKLKIHKILRALLTDELAAFFSYYGKRSKEPFYELKINKALIRAVQSDNVTISDVEDIIKLWFKHAPDRLKSRKN
ncbi:unnamed protein product [Phaedon cochleariae]|uniref:DUF4806 domain-containing protein n=1 Tax=Phaedon cochleariae TaxID=80249 RepID=A0A9N9WX85_PHACE|nr:unnamed protein product [Phaedon cochleariae]